jgi:site-specific DNA-methyltransferase (adenine-specific)
MNWRTELLQGDCLELMDWLPDASVDLVLCDLPYGTTQNKWDSVIPFAPMWQHCVRVCCGAIVLTAAQPFTSALVMSRPDLFRHSWIWQKEPSGNLNAKRMPMPEHEDVLVFGRSVPYFPQGLKPTLRKRSASDNSRTENYGAQKRVPYTQTVTGYPTSILPFAKERTGVHPTQKPVALMEYLIRTYTNPGETVLDFTMGSGTTGVACVNAGRNFIGIEKDAGYFQIAKDRIEAAKMQASCPPAFMIPDSYKEGIFG